MDTTDRTAIERLRLEHIDELDGTECWRLLEATEVGRLAVSMANHPDIFPINYVVDDETIVFRSGAGTKLAAAVLGRGVAFEIDGYDAERGEAWSVVIKGQASEVEGMMERMQADDLPLFPWHVGPKPNMVRIHPEMVTGRRFRALGADEAQHADHLPYMSPD